MHKERKSSFQIWLMAARPKTLPAAAAVVIAGSGAAFAEGAFQPASALAALLVALLMQVGANLANDVYDFYRGADAGNRLGPIRVTQAGLLSPQQVLTGMWLSFGMAGLIGLYLAWVIGWPVLVIGLLTILAAITYTGGPFPFGYYGLGDLAVFIFFGLVGVCGTYYVQAGTISALAWWTAIPMGLLTVNILVVNNLRDIENDRLIGKKTLAVQLGASGARLEYLICLILAYTLPVLLTLLRVMPLGVLLCWLTLPQAVWLARFVYRQQGRALNRALAASGQLELFFGILLAVGMVLG